MVENSQAVLDVLEFVDNQKKKEPLPAGVEEVSSPTEWKIDDLVNKVDDPEKTYVNMEKIGEGAAGEVFLATKAATGDKVAVKKMEIQKENLKLMVTEIGIMKTSQHANVVGYYDTCALLNRRLCSSYRVPGL